MDKKYTILGDEIPQSVGSINLPHHLRTSLPPDSSVSRLMELYVEKMCPSKGSLGVESRFGGLYLGRYYEALVSPEGVDVWAFNPKVVKDITDIFAHLQETA